MTETLWSSVSQDDRAYAQALTVQAGHLIRDRRPGLAEAYAREAVQAVPHAPHGHALLGILGLAYGAEDRALGHFTQAVATGGPSPLSQARLTRLGTSAQAQQKRQARRSQAQTEGKILLSKAWGYGFWSDVFHLLGQALIAEATGRRLVSDWEEASLYWHPPAPGEPKDIFRRYFAPLDDLTAEQALAGLAEQEAGFYPKKWDQKTAGGHFFDPWVGPGSQVFGPLTMKREEPVVISDFFTSPMAVLPWMPLDHPLSALPPRQAYGQFLRDRLQPKPIVTDKVSAFYEEAFGQGSVIGFHIRGPNKGSEAPDLDQLNLSILEAVETRAAKSCPDKLLVISDNAPAVALCKARFGDKLVASPAFRPEDETAVPFLEEDASAKAELTFDILMDTYLAARCDQFVGNGWSNVGAAVALLKEWEDEAITLIGGDLTMEAHYSLFGPKGPGGANL